MSAEIDHALNIALKNVAPLSFSSSQSYRRTENCRNSHRVCRGGGSTINASASTSRTKDWGSSWVRSTKVRTASKRRRILTTRCRIINWSDWWGETLLIADSTKTSSLPSSTPKIGNSNAMISRLWGWLPMIRSPATISARLPSSISSKRPRKLFKKNRRGSWTSAWRSW